LTDKTFGTKQRVFRGRFEGDFTRFFAARTDDVVFFARHRSSDTVQLGFMLETVFFTSAGRIGKTLRGIKFLLAGRPDKGFSAIAADQSFILVGHNGKTLPYEAKKVNNFCDVLKSGR
jgi:hypothetical protein